MLYIIIIINKGTLIYYLLELIPREEPNIPLYLVEIRSCIAILFNNSMEIQQQ